MTGRRHVTMLYHSDMVHDEESFCKNGLNTVTEETSCNDGHHAPRRRRFWRLSLTGRQSFHKNLTLSKMIVNIAVDRVCVTADRVCVKVFQTI